MNTRDYKPTALGEYYHIYNRGNAKQDIFLEAEDFHFFLLRLRQNIAPNGTEPRLFRPLPQNSFSLVAYCLMPNHFHFLIRQNQDIPPSKLLGKICTSYSKYFNKKYERVGHVFQDQFKQIRITDNRYLVWLSAYIHLNPVSAGIIHDPFHYPFSSASSYATPRHDGVVEHEIILQQFARVTDYRSFLAEGWEAIKNRKSVPEDVLLDS